MKEPKQPNEKVFNNIKHCAKSVWSEYDNAYGYVDEKHNIIDSITNFKDNVFVFVRMFDGNNKMKLFERVSKESREYLKKHFRYF